jgi:glycosyltransferase involved in cell wall biosynthesis
MKVVHLIPNDGLGGVEQAARSLDPTDKLNTEVAFINGKPLNIKPHIKIIDEDSKLNSFRFYKSGFKHLVKQKPDLLICSLWRTSIIGIAYYLYRRIIRDKDLKLVVFIHADKFAHIVDKIITKTIISISDEVWCDSYASKVGIFKDNSDSSKLKVISFFIRTFSDSLNPNDIKKSNNFVFWGRIARQKRLDRAINLFKKISIDLPNSLFYIYGPDRGELDSLKELVKKLELSEKVLFMGDKEPSHYPEEALNSKFFINTSSHEGMAIAVTEAMQLGLVPVVTTVGEIAHYCIDGINSIHYNDSSYSRIINSINNPLIYDELSNNASQYWKNNIDYSTDFNQNCIRILSEV